MVIVTVCLAQFTVVLDATVTNVALPAIGRDLHFSTSDLQWLVTAYTLTFGGFLLLGGRSADLFRRRRLFTLGRTIFTLASLANALAQSPSALIVSRAIQGIGAALVSPAALSIITTSTAEGAERPADMRTTRTPSGGDARAGTKAGLVTRPAKTLAARRRASVARELRPCSTEAIFGTARGIASGTPSRMLRLT